MKKYIAPILGVFSMLIFSPHTALATTDGKALYKKNCAMCHHIDRIGHTAPPLFPDYISKNNKPSKSNPLRLEEVIRDGLPATQMPGFGKKLSNDEIKMVAEHILLPAGEVHWSAKDITKSLKKLKPGKGGKVTAQKENITLVMEKGKNSLALLDGNDLSEISRFYVGDVHGGPKFSYKLDKIYAAARNGLITKYDIPTLTTELTVRAGIYLRSLAVSFDDRIIAVANNLPRNIVFFSAKDMKPVHTLETPGSIGGFYSIAGLDKFICSFRDIPELWMIESKGDFKVSKYKLPQPFEDFSISPMGNLILGTKRGGDELYIYDYNSFKLLATIPTDGLPHLASATFWQKGGELFAGVNHILKPKLTVLSLTNLKVVAEVPLSSPGFFVRTHFATEWLWVDTYGEEIVLVAKDDLKKTKILKPHPGKNVLHIEFTREGEYALITVLGEDGEVVAYNTKTLEITKRLPFNDAMGKYNATNKTYPLYSMSDRGADVKGKDVYDKYCMGCHHQTLEAFAPSFSEIASKRTAGEIKTHIASPKISATRLGYNKSSMSKIKLSSNELNDIVDYVLSFKGIGG
ncbi:MAG: c-type cytochrome [Nitrospinota bacterium]|nr:c-type cytochrome [Nitrospinota bacterium]